MALKIQPISSGIELHNVPAKAKFAFKDGAVTLKDGSEVIAVIVDSVLVCESNLLTPPAPVAPAS